MDPATEPLKSCPDCAAQIDLARSLTCINANWEDRFALVIESPKTDFAIDAIVSSICGTKALVILAESRNLKDEITPELAIIAEACRAADSRNSSAARTDGELKIA